METIKFKTIYKPTLWGSETWMISSVKGSESIADGGSFNGLSLPEIAEKFGAELLGHKVFDKFGSQFPLLAKYIDARQDLSIQVHPNDAMAAREHGKMGKNEMWYVIGAQEGACLIDGFAKPLAEEDYAQAVTDGSIEDYLNKVPVTSGDVFYIPAGRVHGIGAGCFIAEIQQSSDVTYRLYDYNRRDKDGNLRQLHTELARKAITFGSVTTDPRTHYTPEVNKDNVVVSSPFFTTSVLDLNKETKLDFAGHDSFHIFMNLSGSCQIVAPCGSSIELGNQEAALVPACSQFVTVVPKGSVKLLMSRL